MRIFKILGLIIIPTAIILFLYFVFFEFISWQRGPIEFFDINQSKEDSMIEKLFAIADTRIKEESKFRKSNNFQTWLEEAGFKCRKSVSSVSGRGKYCYYQYQKFLHFKYWVVIFDEDPSGNVNSVASTRTG